MAIDFKAIAQKLKAEYDKATTPVKTVGKTFEQYMNEQGRTFSAEIFCKQFDILLQYSMLELVVADGKVSGAEIGAVKAITAHGDLVEYINTNYNSKIVWEDLIKADVETVKNWIKNNRYLIDKLANEFVYVFAIVDNAVKKEEIFKSVSTAWASILGVLTCVDGASSPRENEAFQNCYLVTTLQVFEEAMKKIKDN